MCFVVNWGDLYCTGYTLQRSFYFTTNYFLRAYYFCACYNFSSSYPVFCSPDLRRYFLSGIADYVLHPAPKNYSEAEKTCRDEGYDIVSIGDKKELDYILALYR